MTDRSERVSKVVAATLALAGLVLVVSAALVWGTGGFRELPTSFARGVPTVVAGMFAALCYAGAGWLLTSRAARNSVGWLLLTMGLVYAVMTPTALLVDAAHRALRPAPQATIAAAWLVSSFSGPFLIGAGVTAGLLFPDGRVAGPRWRWALAVLIAGAALLAAGTAFRAGGLMWYPTLPNPFAPPAAIRPVVALAMTTGTLMLVGATSAMVLSLVLRYRRSDPTVRAQLRWIMYAGAAMAAVMVPFMVARFLLPVGAALGEAMVAAVDAVSGLLPIAAAVAITRYRLFGIDVLISRTLVYVPVMAILSGMYTASIAIFQRVFVALTGERSDAPLVLTIFLVAAAFTPIRRSLEGLVDRWTKGAGARSPREPEVGDAMSRDVAEVAARVVALQRLEARIAAAEGPRSSAGTRRSLTISADGRVSCPIGGTPHFVACLGCAYLGAISTSPSTVICTHPVAAAAAQEAAGPSMS